MDIALVYFNDCPNWKLADERLAAIAAERPDIAVTHHVVESVQEAERMGFHGSPSILVDGVDAFADAESGCRACRAVSTRRLRDRPVRRLSSNYGRQSRVPDLREEHA